MKINILICVFSIILIGCRTLPHNARTVTPEALKELSKSIPQYFPENFPGFEALIVFERFGGDLIIAQQWLIDDGIYSIRRTMAPINVRYILGPHFHGFFLLYGIWYIYHPGFGCYELSLLRRLDIIEHRGINMEEHGPHVWNIIDGVVIDVHLARQNMETFLDTVIVKNYTWIDHSIIAHYSTEKLCLEQNQLRITHD